MTKFSKISFSFFFFTACCCAATAPTKISTGSTARQENPEFKISTIFGNWSRNPQSCKHPELSFTADSLKIQIDADGDPIRFSYTPVSYTLSDKAITAQLGKQHPYGHTKSKESISFDFIDHNSIKIETTKFEPIKFIRCKKGMTK
jgi:hypothetical protein